ncbi:hypothetical protein BABA_26236 [Neobacillus bataviensis LMG 21833]|uniref:Uncharacterized protein n=1 Tax=Neobacillus bataviensis LMG 21833 TaxID=1117379 RepID=K6D282_9BACI|nr:hypothetical protein BABA_26236 [Neobacillus bataviensis LMG 21833]
MYEKRNGKIPAKLGNTHISLKIRGVFPFILSKSLDFVLFRAVNRNISAYILLKAFPIYINRKFSAYEFAHLHKIANILFLICISRAAEDWEDREDYSK